MGNNAKPTADSGSKLDDKESEISHKVWEEETKNPHIKINENGSMPLGIENKLIEGLIYSTDYTNPSGDKTFLMKVNNRIYKVIGEEL